MFDGLKDKLGRFREDAEEAAAENAEPVEEEAPDDAAAEVDDADAAGEGDEAAAENHLGSDAAPETDPEADAAGEAAAESTAGAPAAGSADDAEAGESNAAATTDAEPPEIVDPVTPRSEAPLDAATGATENAAADATDADAGEAERTEGNVGGVAGDEADEDAGTEADDADDDGATADEPSDDAADEGDENGVSLTQKAKSFTRGKFVIEEEDLEGPLQDLEMALLASDVEMAVARELLDRIRDELVGETRTFTTGTGEVVEDALRTALLDVVGVGQFDVDRRIAEADKPVVIVFTGVNGVGKTTSIAKLSRYLEERGYSSVMANGDTFRAGANEQIEEHADTLGVKCISHEQGGDPAAVIYDGVEYAEANDVDVVLGDTAGRLHTSEGLMDQLQKIDRVVDPDLTLFVDEAVAGQDAVNRAREFHDAAPIDGSILTKADADAQGGAAISIAHVTGKPILFLGTGQGYDDLERFDPEWLVDQLLGAED